MKDYRELAHKIVSSINQSYLNTNEQWEVFEIPEVEQGVIEVLTDHFTPDGELVERAETTLKAIIHEYNKGVNRVDKFMFNARETELFANMLVDFHLQESINPEALRLIRECYDVLSLESEYSMRNGANRDVVERNDELRDKLLSYMNQTAKPTPIDDKGIAERAKEFCELNSSKYVTQPAGTWDMLADFAQSELDRVDSAWIPVSDRLPEDLDKEYLLLLEITDDPPYEEIFVGQFGETNEWGIWEKSIGDGLITHWMPLPEPPTINQ